MWIAIGSVVLAVIGLLLYGLRNRQLGAEREKIKRVKVTQKAIKKADKAIGAMHPIDRDKYLDSLQHRYPGWVRTKSDSGT